MRITTQCRWCGSSGLLVNEPTCDRHVTGYDVDNGPVYFVECQRCGACGPLSSWAYDAMLMWNVGKFAELTEMQREERDKTQA